MINMLANALPKPSIETQQLVSERRIVSAARLWGDRRELVEYLDGVIREEHGDQLGALAPSAWLLAHKDDYPDEWQRYALALHEVVDADKRLMDALSDDQNIGLAELFAELAATNG
jgi:hypothetical protein